MLYKAKRKDNNKWITGSLVKQDKTTYCFKEDYKNDPDNTVYYIAFDKMTDWGLPNRHLLTEVIPETICEAVRGLFSKTTFNEKEYKRQLFEGDIVNIKTSQYFFQKYVIEWSEKHLS